LESREVRVMAKLARSEKGERPEKEGRGAIAPWRVRPPAFPMHLMERIDEIFGERLGPWWPNFGWPEGLLRTPPIDVYEERDQIVLKAELPGMKREEIDVQVAGEVITISGRKEKEEKVEKKDYFHFERSAGSFRRSVRLPADVDLDKVTAQLKDGILEIRAPKAETAREKNRKIDVA
jgi:HSP20 family protein